MAKFPAERLPAELRLEILTLLDLEDLRSLIGASPVFHRLYANNRRHVLDHSFHMTMPGQMPDIIAVHRTLELADFAPNHAKEEVIEFLQDYHQSHASYVLTEAQLVQMANFYFAYVVPVRDRYITWALHNMVRGTQYSRPVKPSTSTEKQRVSGALYRFQLGCNVFCRPYANAKSFLFSKDEIHDLLLQNFHPWDIEAVNCIYLYMDRFFDHVLDLAVDRVDPRQAMDYPWDRLVDPCSHTYLCADECFCSPAARENILPQISCSGLPFVSRVTSLVDDRHPDLVHVVHDYLTEWRTKFFSAQGYTGGVCGLLTSITEPIPQNKRLALRSASPFIGDVMDGPPYAWVTLWRDTYSDMAGIYTPYKLKNWGYVMWDAIRVFNEGGISLLKRQWDERCVNEPYDGAEFFGSTSESS